MFWWLVTIAVWFAVSLGSVCAVVVATEIRRRRARWEIADVDAAFEALVASLEREPRTLA